MKHKLNYREFCRQCYCWSARLHGRSVQLLQLSAPRKISYYTLKHQSNNTVECHAYTDILVPTDSQILSNIFVYNAASECDYIFIKAYVVLFASSPSAVAVAGQYLRSQKDTSHKCREPP